MSTATSLPYGSKSLLECRSREILLAQPDNVPRFLSMHLEKMIHSRDEQSTDPKEVAFKYEEQWENIFLLEKHKRTKSLKLSAKDLPSSTPSVSSTSSESVTVSAPIEEKRKTGSKTLARTASQEESVHPADKEERFPFSKPIQKEETKTSLLSPWPVIPPIPQKSPQQVPSQVQGQKSTKKCDITCRLSDCPYHVKQREMSPTVKDPVRTSAGRTFIKDLGLQKSKAEPRPFQETVPYRPKGGHVVDRELEPIRQGAESSCPRRLQIIKYKGMQVQRSQHPPHCGRMHYITLQPNLQRWPAPKSTTICKPVTRTPPGVSKLPNSYLSIWHSPQPPNKYRP
ncbi:uncharacterized protein LOC124996462 [Mugil cephalus]|uniref:uncharacterized protein LOC124996462 n=1 Tax=Mugil cephalus TaxID=48193 RepID=UPI001FB64DC4|nr:uncharacterized protein LOC124996462 [Mugil cephalus]XP_047425452.1 uncharacterized protein LOC124996462 [Mugil cephalus]